MFRVSNDESYKIEFKESELFVGSKFEDRIKWGKCIVAFANRYGGELVIGKKNDGETEGIWINEKFGSNTKSGFDLLKERINRFCLENISPPIVCDINYETNNYGDIVRVRVPRRIGIPHAIIYEGKAKRAYFIRTSHGSEPVTNDKLLEWLFKNQNEPSVTHRCQIVINIQRGKVEPAVSIGDEGIVTLDCIYQGYLTFIEYFRNIIGDKTIELDELSDFYEALTPYAFLNSLGFIFGQSWLIKRYDSVTATHFSVMEQVEKEKLNWEELTLPPSNNSISKFGVDLRKIPNTEMFRVSLPPNTKITLGWENNKSIIFMKHEEFEFKFTFSSQGAGNGLGFGSPYNFCISQTNDIQKMAQLQQEVFEKYNYVQLDFSFDACFDFPENNLGNFEKYFSFAKSIKEFIEANWDYDNHIKNKPHFYKLYSIENKVNKLLSLIENK